MQVVSLPIEQVKPNPHNVNLLPTHERKHLKQMMEQSGPEATPPIIVCPTNGGYMLVDGEQRWQTAKELGWRQIPAIILKIDFREAVRLGVSYNKLRGTINWFKTWEILKLGEETLQGVLSAEELELLKTLGKIPEHVKDEIVREQLNGKKYDLRQLATFAEKYTILERLEVSSPAYSQLKSEAQKTFIRHSPASSLFNQWVEVELEKIKASEEAEKRKEEPVKKTITNITGIEVLTHHLKCPCGREYLIRHQSDKREILQAETVKGELHAKGLEEAEATPYEVRIRCANCGLHHTTETLGRKTKITCDCGATATIDPLLRKATWTWK